MYPSTFLCIAALLSSVYAQTYTSCDPLKVTNCQPDKALGSSLAVDFSKGYNNAFAAVNAPQRITYTHEGAEFTIQQSGDNPTLQSEFYIMFGRVEVVLKAAPGQGIVSSFVLQSDDLDEIDIEWIGGDTNQFQSNFFSKGDTTSYDRGQFHPVSSPQTEYHNYTIDWTETGTTWYVDGRAVRYLASNTPSGYPQTPMALRIGSWAGGDASNSQGTIQWAGGPTDYSKGPFNFFVKSLKVQDYSTGSQYQYGDQSGRWESIHALGGAVNGNEHHPHYLERDLEEVPFPVENIVDEAAQEEPATTPQEPLALEIPTSTDEVEPTPIVDASVEETTGSTPSVTPDTISSSDSTIIGALSVPVVETSPEYLPKSTKALKPESSPVITSKAPVEPGSASTIPVNATSYHRTTLSQSAGLSNGVSAKKLSTVGLLISLAAVLAA